MIGDVTDVMEAERTVGGGVASSTYRLRPKESFAKGKGGCGREARQAG
jgi:hypothetical protein